MHTMVIGRTESGKTTLLKRLIRYYHGRGLNCLVLDALNDPTWGADFVTDDPDLFIDVAKANVDCILMIDESGEMVGHYDREAFWLATQSRHFGHSSFFASQRAQQIAPTVRHQTSALALFRVSKSDAKILYDDFVDDLILTAPGLDQGEYIYSPPFQPAIKKRLFVKN